MLMASLSLLVFAVTTIGGCWLLDRWVPLAGAASSTASNSDHQAPIAMVGSVTAMSESTSCTSTDDPGACSHQTF